MLGSGSARRFGAAVALSGSGDIATVTAIPQRGSVLAPGALVSAAAVTAGIIVFILPAVLGPGILDPVACGGSVTWLYRFTPAAGLSVVGVLPDPRSVNSRTRWPTATTHSPHGLSGRGVRLRDRRAGRIPTPAQRHMTEALHAEWIKLRTFTSTGWLVAGAVTSPSQSAFAVAGATHESPGSGGAGSHQARPGRHYLGQVVIAVLMISEEYATGMIHVTLAFMPAASPSSQPMHSTSPGSPLAAGVLAVPRCLLAGRLCGGELADGALPTPATVRDGDAPAVKIGLRLRRGRDWRRAPP